MISTSICSRGSRSPMLTNVRRRAEDDSVDSMSGPGALRIPATTGVVAERSQLEPLIEHVLHRAIVEACTDLLGADGVPPQVKGYLSNQTATPKRDVERRMVELGPPPDGL